jgi:hypothetical protein
VVRAAGHTDTTAVTVIPDPRFELDPAVDEALYDYQQAVTEQVVHLAKLFNGLDEQSEQLQRAQAYLREQDEQKE